MKKSPTRLVIDEESFRRARERAEAKEALNGLAELIAESFVTSLPDDDTALGPWLKTAEGKKAFPELWAKIVDAYFHALCNPNKK